MKRGIIAESNKEENMTKKVVGSFLNRLVLNVFAEENDDSGDAGDTGESSDDAGEGDSSGRRINYEDLISKARKEEKAKQYNTIKKLREENDTLVKKNNDSLLKIGELETEIADLNKKLTTASAGDTDAVKSLKETVSNLTKEKEGLEKKLKSYEEKEVPSEEEIEQRVRTELEEEYKVKTYKAEKMAELKEDLLVPELVMGTTIEEIDSSIESALARSKEIRESLGATKGGSGKKSSHNKRTPSTPSNPSVDQFQDNEYSAEYIAGLDVSSPEYAEFRKKMGLK